MTVLKFEGEVTQGDACRVYDDEEPGAVRIGGVDLVNAVEDATFTGPVTVAIADDRFSGDLVVDLGWGYSEYTPVDPDQLQVGPHDIIEILLTREGETVTVWVADEPINTLSDGTPPKNA